MSNNWFVSRIAITRKYRQKIFFFVLQAYIYIKFIRVNKITCNISLE